VPLVKARITKGRKKEVRALLGKEGIQLIGTKESGKVIMKSSRKERSWGRRAIKWRSLRKIMTTVRKGRKKGNMTQICA